jgi:hypothetical protein
VKREEYEKIITISHVMMLRRKELKEGDYA